jgi:hypothetical protein
MVPFPQVGHCFAMMIFLIERSEIVKNHHPAPVLEYRNSIAQNWSWVFDSSRFAPDSIDAIID